MPTEAEEFHQALTGGTQPVTEPVIEAPAGDPSAKRSLEDLLADIDDERRKVILAEVSKARGEAKGLRDRLRDAEPKVAEYDRLAAASKTEMERASERATAAESRAQAANRRVARAEVKAALTGLVDNPESIVDDLDMSRFLDPDGEVDAQAVTALKSKFAALGPRKPKPDSSQASGANGGTVVGPAQEFASLLQSQLSGNR